MSEQHISPERLVDYLHGQLPPQEDAGVHEHVEACSECAGAYEAEAQLTDLLRAHARATERDLPPGVVASIHAAIREAPPAPWWASLRGALHPVAVAACIVAGLIVGAYFSTGGFHSHAQASTVDAAYYLDAHDALAPDAAFSDGMSAPVTLTSDDVPSDERAQ